MDHKFQLINHWIFGIGPTFGLEVQRLDGESLPVSPGTGVDALGRCLFVDEPVVCRLRTLRGFDVLTEESTLLWLSYQEEKKDPILWPGTRMSSRNMRSVPNAAHSPSTIGGPCL